MINWQNILRRELSSKPCFVFCINNAYKTRFHIVKNVLKVNKNKILINNTHEYHKTHLFYL